MEVTVPVRGEVYIVPPRKQKARRYMVKTFVRGEIPEVSGEELPVALRVRENPDGYLGMRWGYPAEYRWDGDDLWTPVSPSNHRDNDSPVTRDALERGDRDVMQTLFGEDAVRGNRVDWGYTNDRIIFYTNTDLNDYFEHGNYRIIDDNGLNTRINLARLRLQNLKFVDGAAFETTRLEPGYEVDHGPVAGPPGVRLRLVDRNPDPVGRREWLNLYRADDLDRAKDHAYALRNRDGADHEAFSPSNEIVDVFEPDALRAEPEAPALFDSGHELLSDLHSKLAKNPNHALANAYVDLAQAMPDAPTYDIRQLQALADAVEAGAKTMRQTVETRHGIEDRTVAEAERAVERARARYELMPAPTDDLGPDPELTDSGSYGMMP